MRSITIDELQGFRDALLELAVQVDLDGTDDLIDIVGTGGDGKNTFNISTLACFIVAGARTESCQTWQLWRYQLSGASNVMEQLGISFSDDAGN